MDFLGLSEKFGRVVFSQEEMVNRCSNFDSQPFCKLLVLDTEILDGGLVADFFEEVGETMAFDDISAKSRDV